MQVAVAAVKGDLEEVQCQAVKELAWRFVAAVSDRRSGWLSKPAVRDRRYNGIFSQPHWCRGGSRTEAVQISELPDWFERRSRRPCITERCAIWTGAVREPPLLSRSGRFSLPSSTSPFQTSRDKSALEWGWSAIRLLPAEKHEHADEPPPANTAVCRHRRVWVAPFR